MPFASSIPIGVKCDGPPLAVGKRYLASMGERYEFAVTVAVAGAGAAAAATGGGGAAVRRKKPSGGCCVAPSGGKRLADSFAYTIAATRTSDGEAATAVKTRTELLDLAFALEGGLGGRASRDIGAARKRLAKAAAPVPAEAARAFLEEVVAVPGCSGAKEFVAFLGYKPTAAGDGGGEMDVGELSARLEHLELEAGLLKETSKASATVERQREGLLHALFLAVGMWWVPLLLGPAALNASWALASDPAWQSLEAWTIGWGLLGWLWPIVVCIAKPEHRHLLTHPLPVCSICQLEGQRVWPLTASALARSAS